MKTRNTLLVRFSVIGLAVTIAAAATLGYLLQRDLTNRELLRAGDLAATQVLAGVSPHVTPADMSAPLTAARIAELDTLASRDLMQYGGVVLVKIWNPDGVVIYSNDKSLIGQRFTISEELGTALSGRLVTEVSSLSRDENIRLRDQHKRLLEVYVPLRLRGEDRVVGAYEVYSDVGDLDSRIAHTQRIITTGVFGGFAILYLALFSLVYGASRRLTAQAAENAQLIKDVTLAYDQTIEGWSSALDLRDKETEGHSKRVTDLSVEVAEAMGISGRELSDIRRGALLHDIGKMGVADSILLKPGPLDEAEWEIMRRHPGYAKHMLEGVEFLDRALEIPYSHHEHWDGTGYPEGLRGEAIPLSARIFAVADVWDALSQDRPYRSGWPAERVLEELLALSGIQFDPTVVPVVLRVLDSGNWVEMAADEETVSGAFPS